MATPHVTGVLAALLAQQPGGAEPEGSCFTYKSVVQHVFGSVGASGVREKPLSPKALRDAVFKLASPRVLSNVSSVLLAITECYSVPN